MKRHARIATLMLTMLLAACQQPSSAVPYYRSAERTPEWLPASTVNAAGFHRASAFSLTDQHGNPVTDSTLNNHITVIHFFFTKCGGVCPTTQGHLERLLASMPGANALQVLSHSVTPERDSVAALMAYASLHHIADARWHLLTGPRAVIESLARNSYFVNLTDGRSYGVTDLAHTETLVLVDTRGRVRGLYTGTLRLDIDRLAEDIQALLREQGTMASAARVAYRLPVPN